MMRFAPSLASLLLCGSVLAGCASDNRDVLGSIGQHKNISASSGALPTDVDSGVHQAQQARLAGRYDDAIHTLSQLMLLASDDPRSGRRIRQGAGGKRARAGGGEVPYRATELQPRDWTVYSALGAAYDEAGDGLPPAKGLWTMRWRSDPASLPF